VKEGIVDEKNTKAPPIFANWAGSVHVSGIEHDDSARGDVVSHTSVITAHPPPIHYAECWNRVEVRRKFVAAIGAPK
jgi:hypothetical protein